MAKRAFEFIAAGPSQAGRGGEEEPRRGGAAAREPQGRSFKRKGAPPRAPRSRPPSRRPGPPARRSHFNLNGEKKKFHRTIETEKVQSFLSRAHCIPGGTDQRLPGGGITLSLPA